MKELTKAQFFARIDEAEQEIREGKGRAFANIEELDSYISSLSY